jgi:hypothetical protein
VNTREQPADEVEAHDAATSEPQESTVMELLQEHVPLSLIMDLSSKSGPNSEVIMDEEGQPEESWWEQP